MKKLAAVLCLAAVLLSAGCIAHNNTPGASPSNTVQASPTPSSVPSVPAASASPEDTAAGEGARSAADYFPVKPDVRMTYRGSGNEYAGFVQHVDYIGNGAVQLRTNNGGTESVSVYTVDSNAVIKVFSEGETYYREDDTAMRSPAAETLIKQPLAVGTSWQLPDGVNRRITAIDTDVTVPYGAFRALEVTTFDKDSTTKEYYAPGVGLIKRVFTSNGDESSPVTSELEKYEDGSPLNENARFFYPDFNNNRVAYIDRTIAFHTGESAASKLAGAMKIVPEGSNLTPVMTAGAVLNSVAFDKESGIVTADLSKSFITGMNAGTSLESLILESLADTLSSYYQTDKVAVTIDGGPYESGHFLFNKGELLPVRTDKAVAYQ